MVGAVEGGTGIVYSGDSIPSVSYRQFASHTISIIFTRHNSSSERYVALKLVFDKSPGFDSLDLPAAERILLPGGKRESEDLI